MAINSCIHVSSTQYRPKRISSCIETQHISKKIKRTIDSWTSLPHDVLQLIHRKLCYADQVRLGLVCTSWCLSHDRMKSSFTLPWVTCYSEDFSRLDKFGKLFDPYSRQVYSIDFSRRGFAFGKSHHVVAMASKNGSILFCSELETGFLLFLRNPFTYKVKMLPRLEKYRCRAATFTKNPDSIDCEFLVLCNPFDVDRLCVARFCLSRSKEWSVKYLEYGSEDYSVHYMEGEGGLYCLGSKGGVLNHYNLEDKSWERLTSCVSYQDDWTWDRGHLVENKGDLLMVCRLKTCEKMYEILVFRFDKSEMSWVAKQKLENTAFFLSGRVLLSAPLMVFDGEKVEDCLLFELEETTWTGGCDYCYSLKENKPVESETYDWIERCLDSMTFIDPPYLWNL